MIEDKNTAVLLLKTLDDSYDALNNTVKIVKENCSEEEVIWYARHIGQILARISLDLKDEIYKIHPELKKNHQSKFHKK